MALSIDRLGWAGGEIRRTQCALLEGANCPWQEPSYLEDAIQAAIARASSTLDNIRWFEVTETRGHVEGGKVAYYQVTLKVGFTLNPRA